MQFVFKNKSHVYENGLQSFYITTENLVKNDFPHMSNAILYVWVGQSENSNQSGGPATIGVTAPVRGGRLISNEHLSRMNLLQQRALILLDLCTTREEGGRPAS